MKLKGIGVVAGIAVGPAIVWSDEEDPLRESFASRPRVNDPRVYNPEEERARLEAALKGARVQVQDLLEKIAARLGENEAKVFKTHLAFLNDPVLIDPIHESIRNEGLPAESAVDRAVSELIQKFQALKDPYLQERAADIQDLGRRIIRNLRAGDTGHAGLCGLRSSGPGILFATSLTPSETALLDPEKLLGIVTEQGGKTSHAAILARALNIPTVIGISNVSQQVRDGDTVVLDGRRGEILINPDRATLDSYQFRPMSRRAGANPAESQSLPAVTRDGFSIELLANIGAPTEVKAALAAGAEGVGLCRTEFLFLGRETAPAEEEQFEIYREILLEMAPRRVVFRTLDIGGDKPLPSLGISPEQNPFLGIRGIRLSLKRIDLFQAQLRALLRAGRFGNPAILLPMISDICEVRQTRRLIAKCRKELLERESPVPEIPLGIMIETPASALLAEEMAAEVDFFSIGANDLTQYVLAVDRCNPELADLYQTIHPGVLRLIRSVVEAASRKKKPVEICGETAADPLAVPLFTGMGIKALSMSPVAIPATKEVIRRLSKAEAEVLVEQALKLESPAAVKGLVERFTQKRVTRYVFANGQNPQ